MKTRDKEALEYVLSSGHWRLEGDGSITTRRDRHGRVTDPEIWRPCEFLSTGNRSSTRKRIWVNGQRVYSARVAYTLHRGALPPEGMQVDHVDDDSLNNRGSNLQLLDCHGNIHKETLKGKVVWFSKSQTKSIYLPDEFLSAKPGEFIAFTGEAPVILGVDCASEERSDYTVNWRPDGTWECVEAERPEPIDWRVSAWNKIKDTPRKLKEWWRDDVMNFIKGNY